MLEQGFEIEITENSVDVKHEVSSESPHGRFYAALFFLGVATLALCLLLFLPGKHDRPSMWHDLSEAPFDSSDFIVPLVILSAAAAFMAFTGVRWTLAAYPSDETLHCDQSTLTLSRIPWLDITNSKWVTRSYPLRNISNIRYGVIASAKGSSMYGLLFLANGEKQKVLSELQAPEAQRILRALKALGADVPDDPSFDKRIKETLETRNGSTGWMDRSWMDVDKK